MSKKDVYVHYTDTAGKQRNFGYNGYATSVMGIVPNKQYLEKYFNMMPGSDFKLTDSATPPTTPPTDTGTQTRGYIGVDEKDAPSAILLSDNPIEKQSLGSTQRSLGQIGEDESLMKRSGAVMLR